MLNGLTGGTTITTTIMATETAVTMEIATTGTDIGTMVIAMVDADMALAQMLDDFSIRRGEITGRAIPQPLTT
jgi:hypothetical protein